MTRQPRLNHSRSFKAKVAVAAIKGEKTLMNWRRISMSIRTRSSSGATSCLRARPECSAMARRLRQNQ